MQVQQMAMLVAKAETLRSEQSLPRTVAAAVAPVQALLRLVPEGAEAASVQKVLRPVLRERTARAAVVTVARQQA